MHNQKKQMNNSLIAVLWVTVMPSTWNKFKITASFGLYCLVKLVGQQVIRSEPLMLYMFQLKKTIHTIVSNIACIFVYTLRVYQETQLSHKHFSLTFDPFMSSEDFLTVHLLVFYNEQSKK